MDPERRVLRGRDDSKMHGSPHMTAPLASHPPDSTPLRRPGPGASMDSTARKRSYNMRDMRLGGEQPTNDIDDSPREPKRTRPSPEANTVNGSVRSKLSKRLSLESGGGNGSIRTKVSRRLAKSPRVTPRGEARSRFVEGSMRDRESQRPPQEFVNDAAEPAFTSARETPSVVHERPRSGVFRFGRALANAFNPSYVWQGVFGREKSASPSKEDLDDRKAKAEKAYAELKRMGLHGTRRESIGSSNRDSGIDVDYRTSDERKRDGHVYGPSEDHKRDGIVFDTALSTPMVTVSRSDTSQPITPDTDVPSDPSRGNTRRSSFQALNRMKSHFSLKSIRREDMSPPRAPSAEGRDGSYRIGKKISKKEIARQQKLTKRISNLESQLERARRELQHTLHEPNSIEGATNDVMDVDTSWAREVLAGEESPETHDEMTDAADDGASPIMPPPDFTLIPPQGPPRRRRFVPGALPSLPSERLLLPPQRDLPTTPTDAAPSSETSPEKLSRVIAGTVSMELNSSPMRCKATTLNEASAADASKESASVVDETAASRKRKSTSQVPRKPVPSSDEAEHKRVKPSTRSTAQAPTESADENEPSLSQTHPDASTGGIAAATADAEFVGSEIPTLAAARDIVPGISTSDLRSLYQSSAHAKRLRAIGPASPQRRRVSGNSMGRGTIATERRSISPRSRRVRAAAKQAPITATPGTGDLRGEIVPPLPLTKGVTDGAAGKEKDVGKGKGKGNGKGRGKENRVRDAAWEGWGDDVF